VSGEIVPARGEEFSPGIDFWREIGMVSAIERRLSDDRCQDGPR